MSAFSNTETTLSDPYSPRKIEDTLDGAFIQCYPFTFSRNIILRLISVLLEFISDLFR